MARPWVRELITVLFLAAALFLFLGLSSHMIGGPTARNWMGPLGHLVATIMTGALGWCSFLPAVWLLYLAFFRVDGEDKGPHGPYTVAIAWVAILIALSSAGSIVGGPSFGGSIGIGISTRIRQIVGEGGALLLTGLFGALGLAVVCRRSISDVATLCRWIVRTASIGILISLPKACYAAVRMGAISTVRGVWWFVRSAVRAIFHPRGEEPVKKIQKVEKAEPSLPKPRVRKNNVAAEAKQEYGAQGEDGDAGDAIPRAEPLIVKPKAQAYQAIRKEKESAAKAQKKMGKEVAPEANIFDSYVSPDVGLLIREESFAHGEDDEELRQKAEQIESKLRDFNIAGRVTQVHPGPVITLFEFEPAAGVKVGRIAALQDDLAMSLKASSIRIIAPIPKRGTVGIEVPNKHRNIVRLRDCIESEAWAAGDSLLSVPLGKDTYGDTVVVDIATMPHLLMAGATGTGKSVSINTLLLSLLYRANPADLGLILIDPKVLELSIYDGIPHLRVPVVTDPRQAKAVLSWAVKEMERRYRFMQRFGVRNVDGYNNLVKGEEVEKGVGAKGKQTELPLDVVELAENDVLESGTILPGDDASGAVSIEPIVEEQLKTLPKIVIVIDELADLMLTVGREIEELITRLAQKARAAGIHLIVATQRPSVDVITGLIKANFPARLSFRVSSRIDSRTILDSMGAEKLLGKGDMLYMQPGAVPLKRIHGAFVSDEEVQRVVGSLKGRCGPQYDSAIIAACDKALQEESGAGDGEGGEGGDVEYDEFYDKAVELVVEKGQASTSMIQRAFRIGYNRAARIIEVMEKEGIVGPMDGVRPREILAPPVGQQEV